MNLLIIIPAYNTQKYLTELLKRIKEISSLPVLVVDDGSHPEITRENDIMEIIRNGTNMGKGYSLRAGFQYALDHGFTHAITMDSDLQHPVSYIPAFAKVADNIDLVLGIRTFDDRMPLHRRMSNRITSGILSLLCGIKIRDSQCGYRRYKIKSVVRNDYHENGFMFESEVILSMFRKRKALYSSIKIETIYNQAPSAIRNISDTIKFIKLIIKTIFK